MSKIQSPMLGYNNNVRHKNRVFHIQTEDSGVKRPHIITHLFMDGGRILKSVKTSYAEHVGVEGMSDLVRGMMKDQHKAMFIALRDGQFDHLVDPAPPGAAAATGATATGAAGAAPAAAAAGPAHAPAAHAPAAPAHQPAPAPARIAPAAPPPSPPSPQRAPGPATIPAPPPSDAVLVSASGRPVQPTIPDDSPLTTRDSGAPAAKEPSLTLDIDALERVAAEGHFFRPQSDLPPPPATLFKKPDTGRYRALTNREESTAAPLRPSPSPPRPATNRPGASVRPPPAGAAPKQPPSNAPASRRDAPVAPREDAPQRYAPARPAAIFGQSRPQQGSSIFGEDLISDKSLDEVILSYLAEDLETEGGNEK